MNNNLTGGFCIFNCIVKSDYVRIEQNDTVGRVLSINNENYKVNYLSKETINEVGKDPRHYITKKEGSFSKAELKKIKYDDYLKFARDWDPDYGKATYEQKYYKYKLKYLNFK